jgi:Tfp pilus assembly protein PilE
MRIAFMPSRLEGLRSQQGFTMIIVLGVMLVSALLLAATFAASNGDVQLSHHDAVEKQAYYAALAGIQEYEYQLQNNPNYWQTCATPSGTVPQALSERYEIKLLVASSAPKSTTTCDTTKPFESMIESKEPLANTFRIESTGCAGINELTSCEGQSKSRVASRSIVATFAVSGFLNYVYFTQYELVDPALYSHTAKCEEYYEGGKRSPECRTLVFAKNDSVFGPMHTDDAANVTCSSEVVFGRKEQVPPDVVEINGGTWPSCGGSEPTYYTAKKTYIKGETLEAPESDKSLSFYVEHEPQQNELIGRTELILNGTTNEIAVKNYKEEPAGSGKLIAAEKKLKWPANGLIYIQGNPNVPCKYTFSDDSNNRSDESKEWEEEKGCANVYVQGTYSKSLTIGSENEVIINGNVYPTSVAGSLGSAPTGTTTLGLIATKFVRVYHPCTSFGGNQSGYMESPWIYAAILSTSHSFIVDNYQCGAEMEHLNVYGAIGQRFRGPVGTVNNSGYIKDYKYDGRLATDEPPYFLAPLKAGWKVARETAPEAG